MHPMVQNRLECAGSPRIAQKCVRPNAAHFSTLDGCQNGRFLYGNRQFAAQWIYSDPQYSPKLRQMRCSHPHPRRSHSLPPPHPAYSPNRFDSHHAGTGPHQSILDQSSQVPLMDLAGGGQSTRRRGLKHPDQAVRSMPIQTLNTPMRLLQTQTRGSISSHCWPPSFRQPQLQFHGSLCHCQWQLSRH